MKVCVFDGLDLKEYEGKMKDKGIVVCYKDCKDCHVVVIRNTTTINKVFIENHPNLKYVVRAGVGLDNVDLELCKEKGIEVINAPGSNAFSVAELFFFFATASMRNLINAYEEVKKTGRFPDRKKYIGNNLFGKTIGIIGVGHVGREIVKRLQGWDVKILGYDVVKDEDFANKYGVEYVDLDELVKRSDVIAICVPLNKHTKGMINENLFKDVRNQPILINLSRGEVVKGKDILKMLNEEKIRFYCADVISNETNPTEEDMDLISHERTIITPHLGANTHEALKNMVKQAIERFLEKIK